MIHECTVLRAPIFIAFNVYQADNTKLSKQLTLPTLQGQVDYRLVGVIYFGGFHFTCRIISTDGKIWFNDGRETGKNVQMRDN
ncbi:uncharacterized protein C8Q71DRAFT_714924 [Rhodofomes roseus]|uniref:Uncharacterized protein n=1 Tax=Rhodofomes roseus TaxID=34475 RepID=A0ABQ8K4B8_9APHY|nr:uncharacterized protein C8Q71DRAFT_714924 [Rhodofomes roseus]KAH9831732.1 hypothetical protein C8Q71DRAFT_714924 [Rhodofomes roseus]